MRSAVLEKKNVKKKHTEHERMHFFGTTEHERNVTHARITHYGIYYVCEKWSSQYTCSVAQPRERKYVRNMLYDVTAFSLCITLCTRSS